MSYYENQQDFKARGIDYDLSACLEYNGQPGYTAYDIEKVLAVWEGENDGDDWRWVLLLKDGRFVFLRGWCDFTGWDCQSDAWSLFADSPTLAAEHELRDDAHHYHKSDLAVVASLKSQLEAGKSETWTEQKTAEFRADDITALKATIDQQTAQLAALEQQNAGLRAALQSVLDDVEIHMQYEQVRDPFLVKLANRVDQALGGGS